MSEDELLEKFLLKQLTSEERQLFDYKCKENHDFALKVRDALYMIALVKTAKETSPMSIIPLYKQGWVRVVAALLAIGILSGVIYGILQKPSVKVLASQYYSPPTTQDMIEEMQNYPQKMSEVKDTSEIGKVCLANFESNIQTIQNAIGLYKNNNYEKVVGILQNIQIIPMLSNGQSCEPYLEISRRDAIFIHFIHLYLGISLYETSDYTAAITNLSTFKDSAHNPKQEMLAYWYISLCYLQLNQKELANQTLQKMLEYDKNTNLDLYQQAQKLISSLQKTK